METAAEILVDGHEAETATDIELDASLPVRPTLNMVLKSEFEPELKLDIDSALGLKITDR